MLLLCLLGYCYFARFEVCLLWVGCCYLLLVCLWICEFDLSLDGLLGVIVLVLLVWFASWLFVINCAYLCFTVEIWLLTGLVVVVVVISCDLFDYGYWLLVMWVYFVWICGKWCWLLGVGFELCCWLWRLLWWYLLDLVVACVLLSVFGWLSSYLVSLSCLIACCIVFCLCLGIVFDLIVLWHCVLLFLDFVWLNCYFTFVVVFNWFRLWCLVWILWFDLGLMFGEYYVWCFCISLGVGCWFSLLDFLLV